MRKRDRRAGRGKGVLWKPSPQSAEGLAQMGDLHKLLLQDLTLAKALVQTFREGLRWFASFQIIRLCCISGRCSFVEVITSTQCKKRRIFVYENRITNIFSGTSLNTACKKLKELDSLKNVMAKAVQIFFVIHTSHALYECIIFQCWQFATVNNRK